MGRGSDDVKRAADTVASEARSPVFIFLARCGYVVVGLLHVLIGVIALQIDGGKSGSADQSGAVATVAGQPAGGILLWLGLAACAGLALWQLDEAFLASRSKGARRARPVATAVGKAVVFGALAWVFAVFAVGGRKSSGGTSSDLTSALIKAPGGAVLLVCIGAGLVVGGGYYAYRGISRKFLRDLKPGSHKIVLPLGITGYAAKGLVLALVGILIIAATVTADPGKSTGLDGALRGLRGQPYGEYLLVAVAVGLVCFGLYSVARARVGKF
ncbi:MAG TPA: DUF1206 domain-containing protein [Micrococcaceae bacterium]|jgi:hypothetical protein|nr:DUF1206 domain-containing protein [Micrococcaceae bacterium]